MLRHWSSLRYSFRRTLFLLAAEFVGIHHCRAFISQSKGTFRISLPLSTIRYTDRLVVGVGAPLALFLLFALLGLLLHLFLLIVVRLFVIVVIIINLRKHEDAER